LGHADFQRHQLADHGEQLMTINTAGFTLGSNRPLNHARILWNMLTGTVSGDGSNPAYAANDYTSQRWQLDPGSNAWTLVTTADATIDCLFIAAHNLSGKTVTISTSDTVSGAHTTRATVSPTDNSTICALFNNAGAAYTIREVRVTVNSGSDVAVGIIRAGVALQLSIPLYGGHRPLNLNRVTEAQQSFSETGQWLGRIIKRRAVTTTYEWEYLTTSWYDTNFEPFAKTLPLQPFCIAGNPSKIVSDVGFVWTDRDVEPTSMGIKDYRSVSLNVTGYY
jgi:hypothetical protein